MTRKLFDAEQVLRRRMRMGEAPVRAELTRRIEDRLADVTGGRHHVLRVTDENFEAEDGVYDAVLIDMVLPLVEDVPVLLWRCVKALKPDGLLLATTLGIDSFKEFRDAWAEIGEPGGHVVPLTDVREAGGLLQKLRLALPVVDRDVMTVTFKDFASLYASLRAHGVGNFSSTRRGGLVTPQKLQAMQDAYMQLYGREDGRIPVTVEVIYLHGLTAAENQPVAAKRGSGNVSLVRILDDPGNS